MVGQVGRTSRATCSLDDAERSAENGFELEKTGIFAYLAGPVVIWETARALSSETETSVDGQKRICNRHEHQQNSLQYTDILNMKVALKIC